MRRPRLFAAYTGGHTPQAQAWGVCAAEKPGAPDGICGRPVDPDPCPDHTPATPDGAVPVLDVARARRILRGYFPLDPQDTRPELSWGQMAIACNDLHYAGRVLDAALRDSAARLLAR
ncbi:MAG TPA: hypothetical protein VGG25_02625 [Streptosporangiaceae bacterium]